jgi:hypothetical protein
VSKFIYNVCILLALVKLLCTTLCLCLCDVIATDVENVWLVNFKILPGFRPPQNRPFNMKSCHAIWRFITKNELYGFIILYKTINVIKVGFIILYKTINVIKVGFIILYKTINVIKVYIRPFGLLLPIGPSVCLLQWTFKLFGFPIWGWLFQENVVCTKLDTYSVIYVPVNVVFLIIWHWKSGYYQRLLLLASVQCKGRQDFTVSEWSLFLTPSEHFSDISWRDHVTFWWDDNDVRSTLD